MSELAEVRNEIWRLTFRTYFLSYRQAARQVLDLFRFGHGRLERLAAAMVIGAFFFLVIIAISLPSGVSASVGLGIGAAALLIAWATSAVFVFGKPDEQAAQELDRTRERLEQRRFEAEVLQAEARAAKEAEIVEAEEIRGDRKRKRRAPQTALCDYCDGVISLHAIKCSHCGEILDEDLRRKRVRELRRQQFYPLAAFLSWIFPGLGQIYKGQVLRGFCWMFAVFAGLMCCVAPGVVLSVLNIFDAAIYSEG